MDVWEMMDVRHIRKNYKSLLLRVEAVIAVKNGYIEREGILGMWLVVNHHYLTLV